MRNIENRLRKLDAKLTPPEALNICGLATVAHGLPRERKNNLAPGERVVIDWYQDIGAVLWGRERITNDSTDRGRCCTRKGYLVDVIQELHKVCSYRQQTGSCFACQDTPVAESRLPEAVPVEEAEANAAFEEEYL